MRKAIQHFLWILGLAFSLQHAQGFALLGPLPPDPGGEPWQTVLLGYNLAYTSTILPGGPVWLGDIGGPHNIGEEYRRNAPVVYYAYDQNFSGFFGSNGEAAVDSAVAIMNSITNVDALNLSDYPFEAQSFNYTAQSLFLTDLKSVTLHLLVEQMGLAEPERYTWTLHDRNVVSPPGCPEGNEYIVVQRNFDPDATWYGTGTNSAYSAYVNNVLYTYSISDDCDKHPPDWSAISIPFAVDPAAEQYTAVAADDYEGAAIDLGGGLQIGGFYTGLTRDDVAGLRYLMSTNNINYEDAAAGSLLESTNFNSNQLLVTSDLGALLAAAKTNDPATLETLFPGLVVSSSSNYFTVGVITNITAYFTNAGYGSTYGLPPVLAFATNYTYVPVTNYVDTFANVVIVSSNADTRAIWQTIMTTNYNGGTYGLPPTTNTINQVVTLTNVPSGDYFIIPAGSCGYNIVSTLFTNVTAVTNFITGASTNFTTGTTNLNLSATVNLITYVTNHWFTVNPCALETNATAQYEGIQHVRFVRVPDGDLLPDGTFIQPITNTYTMTWYNPTNSSLEQRTFQRVVTQPDILFTATDQAQGPGAVPFVGTVTRNISFDSSHILNGLHGPGVIGTETNTVIAFNKVGANFWNGPFPDTNSFIFPSAVNETNQIPGVAFASFDNSTNDPVIYPDGTSIQNIEKQMVIQISPTSLPDGTNGVVYPTTTFATTGGNFATPYTWSASNLPLGLALISNSDSTATLSGTPTNNPTGTYDVNIQLTDSLARSVNWNYTIIIH